MLIDPNGKIDNAGSTSITSAVGNGFETGINAGVSQIINQSKTMVVAPNPSTGNAAILLNLNTESEVIISITDLNGKTIFHGAYAHLSGMQSLALNLNGISAGMYAVNAQINGELHTEKLVIE